MAPLRISILGATGSIGRQALEVVEHLNASGGSWQVHALAADENVAELAELTRLHGASAVCCSAGRQQELGRLLQTGAGVGPTILSGSDGLTQLAIDPDADIVLIAVYGLAAVAPLLAAASAGKHIALASKEALVAAGRFVMEAVRDSGAVIVPVDSEHSALYQLLGCAGATAGVTSQAARITGVGAGPTIRRAILTASGGPFRGYSRPQLADVTPAQAQRHPTWAMGAGITLNSATLFNKGLEVIEAHHLFGLAPQQIDVLVEPTSRIHAMVELADGSVLMHAGAPDMRVPIQYALQTLAGEPRSASIGPPMDLTSAPLEFSRVDDTAFPALSACRLALAGPWWLSAALIKANEALSRRFRDGELPFLAIGDTLLELARNPDSLGLSDLPEDVKHLTDAHTAVEGWLASGAGPQTRELRLI